VLGKGVEFVSMLKGLLALMTMSEDECSDFKKTSTTKGEFFFALMLKEAVKFCNLNSGMENKKEDGLSLIRALRK